MKRLIALWLATATFYALSLPAPAQQFLASASGTYGPWRSAPIGGGGYLQQVFWAPSDVRRMYMTSDVGGLFRSDDGGQNWRMLHGGLPADAGSYSPRGFAVNPHNADSIMVATGSGWGSVSGVWLSADGGNSWQQTLKARFEGNGNYRAAGNVLVISPHDPNLILAGPLGGGIQRSVDGGKTWTSAGPTDLSPTHILFDRTDARRVWVCAQPWPELKVMRAGLFVSEDAGQTWTQINSTAPTEMQQDPAHPATLIGLIRSQQVARSTDNGRTWMRYAAGLAPFTKDDARTDGTYEALTVGPDFMLAGGQGGHIYRLDNGQTAWHEVKWDKVDEGNWWGRMRPNTYRHFGSALGFIGVDPHDPRHWAFTDWYALYQTHDAGRNWQLTLNGVEMTVINTVAQEPTNPQVFHVGMADDGYFRSPDAGRTMQWITRDISSNIKCIAAAPAQPGRVYATGPREWQWQANELFISDDAGLTWHRSGLTGIPDMKTRRCETVAAHPAKKDEVWLTVSGPLEMGGGGPWRSNDGGHSWTWQGQGLPEANDFFHKDYWVAGPELAISGDGSLVATSDDRHLLARRGPHDAAWTMVPVPDGAPNCVAADALQPGRFYLATQSGGLWRSDDSGQSWKNIIDRDISWVTPDIKVPNRVAAVAPWGVFISNDAGATWRDMSRALPYRHSRDVVCFAGDEVVVGTGGNGVFYAPLASLQGAATPRARGVAATATASTEANLALVKNGDMTAGTAQPEGWELSNWKQGTIALKRDTKVYASAPASLLVETQGKASSLAHQLLQPTPKGALTVEGKIKTAGTFDNVQIILQIFDAKWTQLDWKVIADGPKTTADWQAFKGTQTVRDDAAYVLLGVSVGGTGSVWVDDIKATPAVGTVAAATSAAAPAVDAPALPVAITPANPALHYAGRFDRRDPAGPRCAWPACSLALRFQGTALNARLNDNDADRWQVEVDGALTTTLQMRGGAHLYNVASGLPAGPHTVRLVKATEAFVGTSQILGLQLNAGGKLLPCPAPAHRLEIIGDSISAGYGNEAAAKEEHFSPKTENADLTYGAVAARKLGADYFCEAWSGKKMWPDNTIPELYDLALPQDTTSQWDFTAWTPDVVLINLATNDFGAKNPDEAGWTGAYEAFIKRLRGHYPHAAIYCAIGPMMGDWGANKPLTTLRAYLAKIVTDLQATGDQNVRVIDFGTQDGNNGFGADWHPNVKTHQIMADKLVETLKQDLKW